MEQGKLYCKVTSAYDDDVIWWILVRK